MSVLLRQPHGFEGLCVIPEELHEKILPSRTVRTPVNPMFASGPRPTPCQTILTATRSPTSMKSLIRSMVLASKVSRSCATGA